MLIHTHVHATLSCARARMHRLAHMAPPVRACQVGRPSTRIVEAVDLYQTMVELAGLPPPTERLEGTSFADAFAEHVVEAATTSDEATPRAVRARFPI